MSTAPVSERKFSNYTIFVCLFTALGGFLFGYGAPCGSSAIYQGVQYCITSTNKSLMTSLLSVGTLGGALSGAYFADFFGRRGGIWIASGIFVVGAAVQTGTSSVAGIIAGRVVSGFGVGLISCCVPMYISEAAPPTIRGALVSCYQLAITLGILVAQLVSLGMESIQSTAAWRVPVGLQMLWGVILISGCFFIPESPRYLVRRGRVDQARTALAKLRSQAEDSEFVNREMAEIEGNLEFELALGAATYADCFRGDMKARSLTGILVQMFQQLTGVNFIFYYGTGFFQSAGIANPYTITVAVGVVNVGMTFPGIYLMERLGRRKLLIYGAIWMSACNLIVGSVAAGSSNTNATNPVLIAFTLLFIGAFAATWGPTAWVLISELYPLKLRAKAMSLATASNWFWNWAIAFAVPYITDEGQGNLQTKIAFIWFATSLAAATWTYFCVPETKGHSLEELDEMFASGIPFRQTPGWKPSGESLHGKAITGHSASSAEDVVEKKTEV